MGTTTLDCAFAPLHRTLPRLIAGVFLTLGTALPLRGRYQQVSRLAMVNQLTLVTVMLML